MEVKTDPYATWELLERKHYKIGELDILSSDTYRRTVTGGWLYRVREFSGEPLGHDSVIYTSVALAFVPECKQKT